MEQNYIGYLLKALDPQEMRDVEAFLKDHPEEQRVVQHLKNALKPLTVENEFEPPADLVMNTIGRIAEYAVTHQGYSATANAGTPVGDFLRNYQKKTDKASAASTRLAYPSEQSEAQSDHTARRNVIAALGLTFALMILSIPAVLMVRDQQSVLACQNNLRQFHAALIQYSNSQPDQQLPMVGENQPGYLFVMQLQDRQVLSEETKLQCPANAGDNTAMQNGKVHPDQLKSALQYAYTFGYRDSNNQLHGLRRGSDVNGMGDRTPILADTPHFARCAGPAEPVNHRKGQNVLFLGGNVQFTTNSNLGLPGDSNIFCNERNQNRAGLNWSDIVLGRSDEMP